MHIDITTFSSAPPPPPHTSLSPDPCCSVLRSSRSPFPFLLPRGHGPSGRGALHAKDLIYEPQTDEANGVLCLACWACWARWARWACGVGTDSVLRAGASAPSVQLKEIREIRE